MKKYQLSDRQVSTSLSGASVILNHEKGMYYQLDEVGNLVWNTLQKSAESIDGLVNVVTEEFDIDEQTCREDIENLLRDLCHEGLVEEI